MCQYQAKIKTDQIFFLFHFSFQAKGFGLQPGILPLILQNAHKEELFFLAWGKLTEKKL